MYRAALHHEFPGVDSPTPSVEFSSLEELHALVSSFTSCVTAPVYLWASVPARSAAAYLPSEAAFSSFFGSSSAGEELHVCALCVPAPPRWAPSAASEAPLRAAAASTCARWPLTARNIQAFAGRLQGMGLHVGCFAEVAVVEKARGVVPVVALAHSAAAAAAAAGGGGGGAAPFRYHLLRALLGWFKGSFFTWVNSVPCEACGGGTSPSGGAPPTPAEREGGGAGAVELHRCTAPACGKVTRFPRFNAPGVLLDTRRGRCGEWTNAFVVLALALGFEARHVTDFTDHVWAEVRLPRVDGEAPAWLHADPCEAALDTPLLYEKGWGKKLSFVFAAGFAGFRDVTRRCASSACAVASLPLKSFCSYPNRTSPPPPPPPPSPDPQ